MVRMHFAVRSDFGPEESAYGAALRRARRLPGFIDLTVSNPTHCGFRYPVQIAEALSLPQVLQYDANPLGLLSAREAVAGLYRDVYGVDVPTEHILLTASTSEAYGYLLRLLCDPGDAVLVPSPSYPLFDLLARLHDVELHGYPLLLHDDWRVDEAALREAITPRTRAIIAIHPNNPTGSYLTRADAEALFRIAAEYGLPLIVDEVFLDYAVEGAGQPSFAAMQPPVLTFVLGGLSKLLALPQMKLAWTAVCGPQAEVAETLARLEVIADTFLSVGTPPQVALPHWLRHRAEIQAQITHRVHSNLVTLDMAIRETAVSRLRVGGGWSAVFRVPANEPDEELAVRLLKEQGIALHPGSFYGMSSRGWLVVSLLPQPGIFHAGIERLIHAF